MTLLNDFLEDMKKKDILLNYVQVWHRGELLEEYQRLAGKTRLNVYSVSKSVTSLGVGIAMQENRFRKEDRLLDFFPEYTRETLHPNLGRITIRNLLTMNCGAANQMFFGDDEQRYRERDWIAFFMGQDFPYEPGTHFSYCNFNTYLLSCIVERTTGTSLLDYMKPRFFEPLHIGNPDWLVCPHGHTAAAFGLMLTIDEMSVIGNLLLQNGSWEGTQLVPAEYIKEATRNQIRGEIPKNGYGYQFWINPDETSYRADGKYGQYIVVVPEAELVVSLQALESKKFYQDVWTGLVEPYKNELRSKV